MTTQDASQPSTSGPDLEAVYVALASYPFSTDSEYQAGLAAILGPQEPSSSSTKEDLEKSQLISQAQCFYFSRKFNITPTVNPTAYAAWLQSRTPAALEQSPTTSSQPDPSELENTGVQPTSTPSSVSQQNPVTTSDSSSSQEPPYPNSFAAIVDLITRNLPIPGIEEIPPTVLELGSSRVDKTPRRRKPWEKDTSATVSSAPEAGDGAIPPAKTAEDGQDTGNEDRSGSDVKRIDVNGHKETGEGVVKILQPNAIPDSGLLSKD